MTTITTFVKKQPLWTFLVLTFAISWGGILLSVGPGPFPPAQERMVRLLTFGYVAMLLGPTLSGILVTGLVSGRAGLRDLLSRFLHCRVGMRWYVLALLTAPLSIAAVLFMLLLISPDYLPRLFVEADKSPLLLFSTTVALLVGIFEELGWTGLFVHTFLARGQGVLRTGLIVGLLYSAWNSLVVFGASPMTIGTLPLAIYLPLGLLTWQPAYRILMVWVYNRTGSLLVAMLMQASLVAFWTSLTPAALVGATLMTFYLVLTVVFAVVIAFCLGATRRDLSEPPLVNRTVGTMN